MDKWGLNSPEKNRTERKLGSHSYLPSSRRFIQIIQENLGDKRRRLLEILHPGQNQVLRERVSNTCWITHLEKPFLRNCSGWRSSRPLLTISTRTAVTIHNKLLTAKSWSQIQTKKPFHWRTVLVYFYFCILLKNDKLKIISIQLETILPDWR